MKRTFFWPLLNFVVLAVWGVLLRYMQLFSLPGLKYTNLLHAHSHFAFAGWIFLAAALLILQLGDVPARVSRNLTWASLFSAFGMLISFSIGGYNAVSITFSTFFIFTTYWFSWLIVKYKVLSYLNYLSRRLIAGSLFYLCLSSLGPFAMAPVQAAGLRDTPWFQDTVYFYLHFQMNGWMLLAVLGLFASVYLKSAEPMPKNIKNWLSVFIYSTLPLFLIFTLWAHPPKSLYFLAAFGAVLNLISWIKLLSYFRQVPGRYSLLLKAGLAAITLKIVFQVSICIPQVGNWAFSNRNLIIGYIHLLTLGGIMPVLIDQFIQKGIFTIKNMSFLNNLLLFGIVAYLLLLFIQPMFSLFKILIPSYQLWLLSVSVLLLGCGILYLLKYLKREKHKQPSCPDLQEAGSVEDAF